MAFFGGSVRVTWLDLETVWCSLVRKIPPLCRCELQVSPAAAAVVPVPLIRLGLSAHPPYSWTYLLYLFLSFLRTYIKAWVDLRLLGLHHIRYFSIGCIGKKQPFFGSLENLHGGVWVEYIFAAPSG